VSAIRLFVLSTLATAGPLHGHQIRQQAQTDRLETWAGIKPGSLYGALKRLAGEGLIREVRTERLGNRPERTVYEITPDGRRSLSALHDEALHRLVGHDDPFDLALALSRDMAGEDLASIVADRLSVLQVQQSTQRHRVERADPYLNEAERMVLRHVMERTAAEVRWHEELLDRIPKIVADFEHGVGGVQQATPVEPPVPARQARQRTTSRPGPRDHEDTP
jgi:DNA-binding PadR family transcriptional regulator